MTRNGKRAGGFWLGALVGAGLGWSVVQASYIMYTLSQIDVVGSLGERVNEASSERVVLNRIDTPHYRQEHVVEDGIERMSYYPKVKRYERPIVMQHGMWTGAWCWSAWQALLAEWGWESHAHSLPGHGLSPVQRPMRDCTLDYYLNFLRDEVARYERPILMGHSMGGALVQWFLKYVDQPLTSVVLVAPMSSSWTLMLGQMRRLVRLDPLAILQMMWRWDAYPMVRRAENVAKLLITKGGLYTAEALQKRLGEESLLVMYQHLAPFWHPPKDVTVPMLLLSGDVDKSVIEYGARQTADFYGADYVVVPRAGHNLMMEASYEQTAHTIHHWLVHHVLGE
ncbi:MAG TPA: alpha/beta hydrolase [Anaerolineae bacterium]|nr:alpha/beta hydrolase [Anaerolineae bacterium]